MPQVVKPSNMMALVFDQSGYRLKKVSPSDVGDIELNSVPELMELADSLGVKIVFQVGKEYMFRYLKDYDRIIYFAKQWTNKNWVNIIFITWTKQHIL